MTKPIISVDINATYEKAMRLFDKEKIKRMPVVEDGEVVGLLTLGNLVTHSKKAMRLLKKENNMQWISPPGVCSSMRPIACLKRV